MDAKVEPRFSRSPFFVIVNTETGDFKALENPGASAKDVASVKAVKFLIDKGGQGHNYRERGTQHVCDDSGHTH